MNKITQLTSSRILEFAQRLQLNFSAYTIWNYFWKKYHRDETTTKEHIADALEFLKEGGWIETVHRSPGYFSLTEKGKAFKSWTEADFVEETKEPFVEEQKSWMNWF